MNVLLIQPTRHPVIKFSLKIKHELNIFSLFFKNFIFRKSKTVVKFDELDPTKIHEIRVNNSIPITRIKMNTKLQLITSNNICNPGYNNQNVINNFVNNQIVKKITFPYYKLLN